MGSTYTLNMTRHRKYLLEHALRENVRSIFRSHDDDGFELERAYEIVDLLALLDHLEELEEDQ